MLIGVPTALEFPQKLKEKFRLHRDVTRHEWPHVEERSDRVQHSAQLIGVQRDHPRLAVAAVCDDPRFAVSVAFGLVAGGGEVEILRHAMSEALVHYII